MNPGTELGVEQRCILSSVLRPSCSRNEKNKKQKTRIGGEICTQIIPICFAAISTPSSDLGYKLSKETVPLPGMAFENPNFFFNETWLFKM